MSVPDVGTSAPDFSTNNQHGEAIRLSSLRGAPVVMVFYPLAFSGICTVELRELRDNLEGFNSFDARILAISTDTMFSLRVFAEQEMLTFDLLSDHWPHGGISQSYGVFDQLLGCALRGSFVIDADGIISWSVVNQIGEARDIASHLQALSA